MLTHLIFLFIFCEMTKIINFRNLAIGKGRPLAFIAGPCVIENHESCLKLADKLKTIFQAKEIPFIFKASYDKANRTSVNSYRGPGIKEGIRIPSLIPGPLYELTDVRFALSYDALKINGISFA